MKIEETALPGVFAITPDPHRDERGAFTRLWCHDEFAVAGIDFAPLQVNLSSNARRGTLRGMHFQRPPFTETKLVHAVRGAIFDVVVDLRPGAHFGRWIAEELSAENQRALFIPPGLAHGFLTLCDDADVLYHMGEIHQPGQAAGLAWDDPEVGITWPFEPSTMSEADRHRPGLDQLRDVMANLSPRMEN